MRRWTKTIVAMATLAAIPLQSVRAEPEKAGEAKSDGAKSDEAKKDDEAKPAPFSEDKTVKQAALIGGSKIGYDATVGHIPVRDDKGKTIAEVVYTAYVVPGGSPDRPVTFAFNGGPGASSVYLNLGAIGPKRVQFGDEGDAPSDSPMLKDNANSWLDFTDLVFIDPVGTGFSRSLQEADKTKKSFFTTETDIKYLSRTSMTGWSRTGGCVRPNMSSAKVMAAIARRGSRWSCRRSLAWGSTASSWCRPISTPPLLEMARRCRRFPG